MKRTYVLIATTLVVALVAVIGVWQLPIPVSWKYSAFDFYLPLAGNTLMTCLHIGAAILFVTSLGVYKAKLRITYLAFAVGIVLMAFGTLQVSIITALDAWQSVWVQRGGIVMPFLLSSLTLYLGAQYFARLVETKHILTRVWLVLPIVLIVSILSYPVPHVATNIPEIGYDIAMGVTVWATCLSLAASILMFNIRQHVGAHYQQTMTWLTSALSTGFVLLVVYIIYSLVTTDITHPLERLINSLAILSGILWLGAGYTFARTKEYGVVSLDKLAEQAHQSVKNKSRAALDMVMYAAGLVSNVSDVDPLLDKVRVITSKLLPGQALSDKDTQSLIETYLKIEHYLTTKERIRTFSREGLRAGLDANLRKLLSSHEPAQRHS